ncbi:N-acetylmuramoyl-L-alanine amidase [Clostridium saudiense]|uniref:N-acetylmuramoyl-L-alanine amidase n=1 Tax=Clostridium saudiense TaxID=1414720 RepID=UPI0018ABB87F|nr:N-acetylmuramoyl-L-alanine amidase [Clostridium saudiense]
MLEIQKRLSAYNFSSRNGSSIKYLVLHYTGNKGDTANDNATYFGGGNRNASAHYFIDDNEIVQVVEESNSAWAVGDGAGEYGITNRNSISIEMCCNSDGEVSEKTEANALELVKSLMDKYNIATTNVVRHYDASRKICPNWSSNNWDRWVNFKKKLGDSTIVENIVVTKPTTSVTDYSKYANYVGNRCKELQTLLIALGYKCGGYGADGKFGKGTYDSLIQFQKDYGLKVDGLAGTNTFDKLYELIASKNSSYKVKITASVLNVRKGAGTNYSIATTVKKNEVYTIVEEKNGWGRLKSGAGWISLSYTIRI